jgi:arylsulfatase A-like enzyme
MTPAPIHPALHGLRLAWWIALFELSLHAGLTLVAGPSGQLGALLVGVLTQGALGVLVGATVAPLREHPARAILAIALIFAGLGTLVDGTPATGLAAAVAAPLVWARWRYPGQPSRGRTAFRAVFFACLFGFLAVAGARPEPGARFAAGPHHAGPDVIIVVLDTLRRDHVGAYGDPRGLTPVIDRLAAEGTAWEGWANACWSLPGHATLLTGRYAGQHGAHYEHGRLAEGERTLQQRFGAAGYDTLALTGNPWVHVGNGLGDDFGLLLATWGEDVVGASFLPTRAWRRWVAPPGDKGGEAGAARFARWLDTRPEPTRPYFALVNIFEAHAPYHRVHPDDLAAHLPPGTSPAEAARASEALLAHHLLGQGALDPAAAALAPHLYAASVAGADRVLGAYVDALRTRGRLDRTLLLVTSDHGEHLGEHGLWGHVHGLHEPVLQVPFVLRGPSVGGGARPADRARLIDAAPTLLALAGLPVDGGPPLAGRDLRGAGDDRVLAEQFSPVLLAGRAGHAAHAGPYPAFSERRRSLLDGPFKLHLHQVEGGFRPWRLFDLGSDAGETRDLASADPARVAALTQAQADLVDALGIPEPGVAGTGARAEGWEAGALEALGYVQ